MKRIASGKKKASKKKPAKKAKKPDDDEPAEAEVDFDAVMRGLLAVPSQSTDPRKKRRP